MGAFPKGTFQTLYKRILRPVNKLFCKLSQFLPLTDAILSEDEHSYITAHLKIWGSCKGWGLWEMLELENGLQLVPILNRFRSGLLV